jgi:hypothetical protein
MVAAAWLTAWGTLALAILALAAAIVASFALWKQSKEVRDQAYMLDLTRRQFEEQTEVNKLQLKDLRASLKERVRHQRVAERQQADMVDFEMTTTRMPNWSPEDTEGFKVSPGTPVHMAIVINNSRRPIEQVTCSAGTAPPPGWPEEYSHQPVMVGRVIKSPPLAEAPDGAWMLVQPIPRSTASLIRPGESYGFVFEIKVQLALFDAEKTRFTDDAGLYWQVNRDQHLEPLRNRRDW